MPALNSLGQSEPRQWGSSRAKYEAVRVPDLSNVVPRQGSGQELKRVNRREAAELRGTEGAREEDSKRRSVFPEELVFLLAFGVA
jgi:hypothetical protein